MLMQLMLLEILFIVLVILSDQSPLRLDATLVVLMPSNYAQVQTQR
jgi:hypothetical protein